MDVHTKIPKNFNIKQEYTDVFLLGIKDLDFNNIDDTRVGDTLNNICSCNKKNAQ